MKEVKIIFFSTICFRASKEKQNKPGMSYSAYSFISLKINIVYVTIVHCSAYFLNSLSWKRRKFSWPYILTNPLFTKLVQSRWLDIGRARFCVCVFMFEIYLDSITGHKNAEKKKEKGAKIQTSWPLAWSITH